MALVALFGSLLSDPFVNTFPFLTYFDEPGDSAAPFAPFVAFLRSDSDWPLVEGAIASSHCLSSI
jgi:hypothetical protein